MPHYSSRPIFTSGGGSGNSLEYDWDGTKLGVKVEGDDEFEYTDLKGAKGSDGKKGNPGTNGEEGPKGDPGSNGSDGEQGPSGSDGEDGFPTESQWDELVARVEALEGGDDE